jgi:hypothetical protein
VRRAQFYSDRAREGRFCACVFPTQGSSSERGAVERQRLEIKSQVRNPDLESVTLSEGTPLCPYGIAYRTAYGLSFRWTVPFSLGSGCRTEGNCLLKGFNDLENEKAAEARIWPRLFDFVPNRGTQGAGEADKGDHARPGGMESSCGLI